MAAVVATVFVMGGAGYTETARSVPGIGTSMSSGVLRSLVQISSTVCVGFLAYGTFIRARVGRDRMTIDRVLDLAAVRWASGVWVCTSGALAFVDAADANGLALSRLLQPGALNYLIQSDYLPSAWIVSCACASVVFCAGWVVRRWPAMAVMTGVAMVGLLPPVLVTQVLVGPNHDFGSDAAILGVPATAVLIGTAVVGRLRLARGPRPGRVALRRLWLIIAACWMLAVATDVVLACFELVGTPLLSTPTAWLFVGRFTVLGLTLLPVARGVALARSDAPLDRLRGASRRLLGAALPLLAAYSSLIVAMTRIPPPQYFVPTSITQLFFGYNVSAAPTLFVLAFDWRANILFIVLSASGSIAYLVALIRLRRRGDRWPAGRTIAWLLGWAVVVIATSSGLGRYSSASFSLHMVLHMALNMLAPLLLVLGGPLTLALRALPAHPRSKVAGPREWIAAFLAWPGTRLVYNPVFVFVRFIGAYYLLYFSPIFEQALRYHWAHQLMNLEFLTIGYMFYGLVIGVDAPPRPLPHIGRLGMLLAAMPFHAFFGVAVMSSRTVIAQLFYQYIDAPWANSLAGDQYLGGGIAWAAGEIPLIIVIIALVLQWSRQDRKAATSLDRHLDSGVDTSFDTYNDMLARLSRPAPAPEQAPEPVRRASS